MDDNVRNAIARCERWMVIDPHVRSVLEECIENLKKCSTEISNLRKQINDLRNTKDNVSTKS